jgi:hypothetical protein
MLLIMDKKIIQGWGLVHLMFQKGGIQEVIQEMEFYIFLLKKKYKKNVWHT